MKKFKLNVKKDELSKDIWLFSESDALAIWLIDFEADMNALDKISEATRIKIKPDDKIEIEWIGCHYLYSTSNSIRLDLIKLVKASPAPTCMNRKGMIVTGYAGWTVDALLKLKHRARNTGITIKRIVEDESEVVMPSNDDVLMSSTDDAASKIMEAFNLPKV